MQAQYVVGGVVANMIQLPDGAVIAPGGASASWTVNGVSRSLTLAGGVLMSQAGAKIGWILSGGVLVAPAAPAPTATQLRADANAKARTLLAAARAYTVATGLVVLCDATTATCVDLQGLAATGAASPTATTNFVENAGGVVTLTGAQCVALAQAVVSYAQSVYATLAAAMNGISAGTIVATAQIDALAWPS